MGRKLHELSAPLGTWPGKGVSDWPQHYTEEKHKERVVERLAKVTERYEKIVGEPPSDYQRRIMKEDIERKRVRCRTNIQHLKNISLTEQNFEVTAWLNVQ